MEALREDELDYYPDADIDEEYLSRGTDAGSSSIHNMKSSDSQQSQQHRMDDNTNLTLEKIADLSFLGSGSSSSSIMKGRISDIQWNPEMSELGSTDACSGGGGANLLTIDYEGSCVTAWDVNSASAIPINTIHIPQGGGGQGGLGGQEGRRRQTYRGVPTPAKLSWDPHNTNICAITCGTSVIQLDFRCDSYKASVLNGIHIPSCHKFGVTDLDYNPNKPNMLSTCGQDGLIKFWDLRYTGSTGSRDGDGGDNASSTSATSASWKRQSPVKVLADGQTHWTTVVKYNSFHDQLLLSGGTDGISNLWRISSISSAPLLDLGGAGIGIGSFGSLLDEDEDGKGVGGVGGAGMINTSYDSGDPAIVNQENHGYQSNTHGGSGAGAGSGAGDDTPSTKKREQQDVRVTTMEMSEAVYDVAWSAADAWVYTTLGFDGSVVLNHVPSKEKYKILL